MVFLVKFFCFLCCCTCNFFCFFQLHGVSRQILLLSVLLHLQLLLFFSTTWCFSSNSFAFCAVALAAFLAFSVMLCFSSSSLALSAVIFAAVLAFSTMWCSLLISVAFSFV